MRWIMGCGKARGGVWVVATKEEGTTKDTATNLVLRKAATRRRGMATKQGDADIGDKEDEILALTLDFYEKFHGMSNNNESQHLDHGTQPKNRPSKVAQQSRPNG